MCWPPPARVDNAAGQAGAPVALPGDPRAAVPGHPRRPGRAVTSGELGAAVPTTSGSSAPQPRARRLGHQPGPAARQGRRHPAARARRRAGQPARRASTASPRSTSPGRASSTSPWTPGPPASWRAPSSRRASAYGAERRAGRARGQPGVRLGQPDRPAAHRPHPVGRPGRLAAPAAGAPAARGHPRVLRQRRRRPDGQLRRLGAGPRHGRAGPRGRLPRRVRRRAGHAGARASTPPCSSCRTTRRSPSPATLGYRAQLAEIQRGAGRRSACTSTSGSASATLHDSGAVEQARGPAARAGARVRRRTARSGCAPPTSATTRTGC